MQEKWLKKPESTEELLDLLPEKMWRLHNLYYIINEDGKRVLFRPRPNQLHFLYSTISIPPLSPKPVTIKPTDSRAAL